LAAFFERVFATNFASAARAGGTLPAISLTVGPTAKALGRHLVEVAALPKFRWNDTVAADWYFLAPYLYFWYHLHQQHCYISSGRQQ
jgi:hypothetical protein